MKNNQKELQATLQNILDALSSEYAYDLFEYNYKTKTVLWKNLSALNKNNYIKNTIDIYSEYHKEFDKQKIEPIKSELLKIIENDGVVEFNEQYIYKELYKILGLINSTFQALDILAEKNYPYGFGKLQSDSEKIKSKRALYKKLIIGDDKLLNRKEVRIKYWAYTLFTKNRNLFDFFLYGFLVADLMKMKDLHKESEENKIILSNFDYFLMQNTTVGAVIKSLGILLYGEMTHYLKIPKEQSKNIIKWIIDALFHQNISTDEFYGYISIKSSLGTLPIFGASRESKYSDEENRFLKRKLFEEFQELATIDKDFFDASYANLTRNPHIQYLAKYPLELLRENPKYSVNNL
jgi:hypothetical protein